MTLVSSSIPNLINGISQQPDEIRLSTQAERQVNGLSSVARGLEKRPGTEHKAKLSSSTETDSFIHSIRRDREEEYTMVLSRTSGGSKTLKIYDQDGTEIPVKTTTNADVALATNVDNAALSYLEVTATGGVKDNIVATTVADTTFLTNKTVTVTEASSDSEVSGEGTTLATSAGGSGLITGAYTHEGLIYVKAGDYSSKYLVDLTLDSAPSIHYKVGFQTPSSQAPVNQSYTATTKIAKILKSGSGQTSGGTGDGHWDDFDSTDIGEGFGGWLPTAGRDENGKTSGDTGYEGITYYNGLDAVATAQNKFAFTLDASRSVIKIQCKEAFKIKTSDSKGGGALVGITNATTSFSNLPGDGAPNDYLVKIVGNADATQDDFYVKFNATDKVWKESLGPSQKTGFKVTTMPHRLVRLFDDSNNKYFLYEPIKEVAATGNYGARFGWSSRKAGDDDTNPFPSFTGGKINDVTFHKNRFGILSDENIIFSVAGNFYNFFPISVMTALESNPIDISVSNNEVSILRHAAAFDQSLLLFSDFQQFSLNSKEAFTPSSVSVDVVTQFESTSKTPPVSSGKFVYFPFQRGEYSGVREYFVDTGTADANDATDITSHVPQYIKGNIIKMIVSSTDQMLAVLSDDDLKKVYIYKNYWQGQEKIQNSWSHWEFDGDILNCAFLGSTLKLLVKRNDGIYLEDLNLSLDSAEAVMEDETAVLLDRRVKLTYNQTIAANMPYLRDATCDTSNTSPTVTMDSTVGISAGMRVVGTGIPADTTVLSVATGNTTTFTLSKNATASNTNTTLVFLPSNIEYVTDNARKLLTETQVDEYLAEHSTNVVYAGIPYTFEYEFSRFIHKENELPVQTAKLQIRNINLLYNKTGFFNIKVNVTPGIIKIPDPDSPGATKDVLPRTNYSKNFSGLLTNTSQLGQYKLLSGTFKSSVMTNSSNCNIILENDQYLPCAFMSAEWEGFLHKRNRRV